jgi:hypothetical protein
MTKIRKEISQGISIYSNCEIRDILTDIGIRTNNRITVDEVKSELIKYKSRSDLRKNNPNLYNICLYKCPDVLEEYLPSNKKYSDYTIDEFKKELSKFSSRTELISNRARLYNVCREKYPNLLDQVLPSKKYKELTTEELRLRISKFKSRVELKKNDSYVYHMSRLKYKSILDELIPLKVKEKGGRTYRSLIIEGQEIEFSDGFTELHTHSYENILRGNGFGLEDARKSIEIVYDIRNSNQLGLVGDFHPLAK